MATVQRHSAAHPADIAGRLTFPGTDLSVARMGYGAMQLAGPASSDPPRDPDAAVALAWLLHRSPNILVIPGTSSPGHLRENVAAAAMTLSADVLAQLDLIGAPAGQSTRTPSTASRSTSPK